MQKDKGQMHDYTKYMLQKVKIKYEDHSTQHLSLSLVSALAQKKE
jgi:hypothetical protein